MKYTSISGMTAYYLGGGYMTAVTEKIRKKRLEKAAIAEAMKIAVIANFSELLEGYDHTYYTKDKDGNEIETNSLVDGGKEKKVWVDMSTSRKCSYHKHKTSYGTTVKTATVILGEPNDSQTPPPVEERGITLRQLRAVMANIIKRCDAEGWTNNEDELLSPDKVTLYDADKYVIRPFTVKTKMSFVSSLPSTAGSQPPRFFVSHWWGEPVKDFIACIEQAVRDFARNASDDHMGNRSDDGDRRGGGMTEDTPVWVCAYGNNQWDLADITENPKDSGFTKAMNIAKGRTITVLDKGGFVFSRVWCIYELHLTLDDSEGEGNEQSQEGLWAVYTADKHTYVDEERDAVGIISGGATSDRRIPDFITAREKAFPYDLIKKSLAIKVEKAVASEESDRVHILNTIIGNTKEQLNDNPPKSHDKFLALNESLRGRFASSAASLQGAFKEGEANWKKMLFALSKSTSKSEMQFFFSSGWEKDLTAVQATQLMAHLPLNMEGLSTFGANYGAEFMDAVIERIKEFNNLKNLSLYGTKVVGEEGEQEVGVRLAEVLASNNTIKTLWLGNTNLIDEENKEQWGDALLQNTTITNLYLRGVESDVVDYFKAKTADRSPPLEIES